MSEPKYVNKLHLIYMIIILTVVILALLTITVWPNVEVGIALNNAATASSIVLAVVAIVISLVDVAGQRNTVLDLKETAQTFDENLQRVNQGILEINELKAELLQAMNSMQETNKGITKEIASLKEKYSKQSGQEEGKVKHTDGIVKEFLDDLNTLYDKTNTVAIKGHFRNDYYVKPHMRIKEEKDRELNLMRQNLTQAYILDFMKTNEECSFEDIWTSAQTLLSHIGITRSLFKNELKKLENRNYISRTEQGGYILSNKK
ncbi:hypothetical protein P4631_07840 [Halalkalibacterium halodurans]|uniref:hypothetical protein n=1 Tax=Halalkalibacterium halodurans TaxID=86665 RepID=UPI002E25023E|nr:hypothetical protein [Halalkalibacterium halodurans]